MNRQRPSSASVVERRRRAPIPTNIPIGNVRYGGGKEAAMGEWADLLASPRTPFKATRPVSASAALDRTSAGTGYNIRPILKVGTIMKPLCFGISGNQSTILNSRNVGSFSESWESRRNRALEVQEKKYIETMDKARTRINEESERLKSTKEEKMRMAVDRRRVDQDKRHTTSLSSPNFHFDANRDLPPSDQSKNKMKPLIVSNPKIGITVKIQRTPRTEEEIQHEVPRFGVPSRVGIRNEKSNVGFSYSLAPAAALKKKREQDGREVRPVLHRGSPQPLSATYKSDSDFETFTAAAKDFSQGDAGPPEAKPVPEQFCITPKIVALQTPKVKDALFTRETFYLAPRAMVTTPAAPPPSSVSTVKKKKKKRIKKKRKLKHKKKHLKSPRKQSSKLKKTP